jgi:predicted glutamine amidotransferase
MCRWLAYVGSPITPKKYLYDDQYSLVEHSLSARKSISIVNGDGFGLGWYGDHNEPGLFREVLPAWNDDNLKSLSLQIRSGLFLAHVRAATDTSSSRNNCHPFKSSHSLFMHNGKIGDYLSLRRELENLIPDTYFRDRTGTNDSEAIFLLLESLLEKHSFETSVNTMITSVIKLMGKHQIEEPFRLIAAWTDGQKLRAIKLSTDDQLPSLYYREVESGWLLVSEPLDSQLDQWSRVPDNHWLEIDQTRHKPLLTPISIA